MGGDTLMDYVEKRYFMREIRRTTKAKKKKRQPCAICGKHLFITELHHLISVSELAEMLCRNGSEFYPLVTVWLCPNHHVYWHRLRSAKTKLDRAAILLALGKYAPAMRELEKQMYESLKRYQETDGLNAE